MNVEDDILAGSGGASAGAQLRRRREELGLSILEAAQQLRISPQQVEAMETDCYDCLPGSAFARGFLKNYARFLGLDEKAILSAYDSISGGVGLRPTERVLPTSEAPLMDYGWRTILGSVLVLVLLVGVVWWFLGGRVPPEALPEATAPAASPPATATVSPSVPRTIAAAAAPVSSPTPSVASSPSAPVLSAPPVAAAISAPATVSAPAPQSLLFHFTGDCWVQVRDATGKQLLARLGRAGEALSVVGEPPYQVLIGNVRAVDISYEGRPVPLPANSGSNVARLRIGVTAVMPAAAAASVGGTAPAQSGPVPAMGNAVSAPIPSALPSEVSHAQ